MTLPIRERNKVSMDRSHVPHYLRTQVIDTLYARHGRYPESWLEDIWEWKASPENNYGQASWMKRMAKYMKDTRNITLTAEEKGELGDMVGSVMNHAHEYVWDIDDMLDWGSGDFGDGGSCFWGDRRGARRVMRDNGGMALRCYENGAGVARAWFTEVVSEEEPNLFGDERGEVFVLFNGYGYSTHEMALLLANIVAGSARKIALENNGYKYGLVYINNFGYLIGNPETIHAMDDYYDLGWSVSGYSQYYRV